jgi:hypothetical protein
MRAWLRLPLTTPSQSSPDCSYDTYRRIHADRENLVVVCEQSWVYESATKGHLLWVAFSLVWVEMIDSFDRW